MSSTKRHDDVVRVETIATLDSVEAVVLKLCEVFREVAEGTPLDPQHAENLSAQCVAMLKHVVDARNNLRLAGSGSTGVH